MNILLYDFLNSYIQYDLVYYLIKAGHKCNNVSYDKEVDKRIHDIIVVLEPTLVIILSLIVGMILLSVILPLMGIMSSIG